MASCFKAAPTQRDGAELAAKRARELIGLPAPHLALAPPLFPAADYTVLGVVFEQLSALGLGGDCRLLADLPIFDAGGAEHDDQRIDDPRVELRPGISP